MFGMWLASQGQYATYRLDSSIRKLSNYGFRTPTIGALQDLGFNLRSEETQAWRVYRMALDKLMVRDGRTLSSSSAFLVDNIRQNLLALM